MEKWSRLQVLTLIEAYREESCLYAVKSPNYHNRNLRMTALKRVTDAVHLVRETTTEKECQQKFRNLRIQFNMENTKRKTSLKSGIGADDVYVPKLWYYEHMVFLDEHVIARKSKSSPIGMLPSSCTSAVESSQLDSQDSDDQVVCESPNENNYFCIVVQNENTMENPTGEPTEIPISEALLTTCSVSLPPSSPMSNSSEPSLLEFTATSSPSTSAASPLPSTSAASPLPSTPAASPVPRSSSGFSSCRPPYFQVSRIQKRRRNQSDESYVGAIESIAEGLRQSIPSSVPIKSSSLDTVDLCMQFVGKMLKEIKNENIKLKTMTTILQTVMTAKTADIGTEVQ